MSYRNGKSYTDFRSINLKAEGGLIRFDDINVVPVSTTGEFLLYVDGGVLYYDNGSSAVALGAGGGGGSSLDGAYDAGRTITVNQGAVTLNGVNEDTAVLSIAGDGDSGGALLAFAHTTATRNDVLGTGSTWKVTGQGNATFNSVISATIVAASSSNVNLAIDAAGSGTITIGGTSTGAVTVGPAVTLTASATITGTGGSTVFTITAGDAVLSDGSVAIVDADNANSLKMTNNTATTIGASAATGLVEFISTSLTTGTLLSLQLTEGTLNGGFYLKAYDATAGAAVFSVAENGDVAITGTAAANAFAITSGDVLISDGSITLVDADNAASLSITNSTATTASVVAFVGAGAFTGSTTSSWMTITPSGLTTGTAVYLPVAAMTTGKGIHMVANAITSGIALHISSSAASTQLTGNGRLLKIDHSGNATGSGIVAEINSAAADETIIAQITASGLITGSALKVDISASAAGTGLLIAATEATLTTGKYIDCYDGAASDFTVAKYGATVIAGNAIGTASLTQTNGDHILSSGNLILTAGHIKNTPQAIVNANTAISIVTLGTTIANNGASTHTLADGTVGQIKYIVCTVYTGDAVITPANFVGTTITLNAAGDSWTGVFVGTEWVTLALGGTAAVA